MFKVEGKSASVKLRHWKMNPEDSDEQKLKQCLNSFQTWRMRTMMDVWRTLLVFVLWVKHVSLTSQTPSASHNIHINIYHFNISSFIIKWNEIFRVLFFKNAKSSTADLQRYKKLHHEIQRLNIYFTFIYYVICCAGWRQLCHYEFVFLIVWITETSNTSTINHDQNKLNIMTMRFTLKC